MTSNLKRLKALVKLGDHLLQYNFEQSSYRSLSNLIEKANAANSWFTANSIQRHFLIGETLCQKRGY